MFFSRAPDSFFSIDFSKNTMLSFLEASYVIDLIAAVWLDPFSNLDFFSKTLWWKDPTFFWKIPLFFLSRFCNIFRLSYFLDSDIFFHKNDPLGPRGPLWPGTPCNRELKLFSGTLPLKNDMLKIRIAQTSAKLDH